jgi:hypothetical protein
MGPLRWRTNLRANLVLWPEPAANIRAIVGLAGRKYDEDEFLKHFGADAETDKTPRDARSVRNTFEVLTLSGLAFKSEGEPALFLLTDLGKAAVRFLGLAPGRDGVANEANIHLLAHHQALGLGAVSEIRAIWALMRRCDNRLSNEELNRAMFSISSSIDIERVAQLVLTARATSDPTIIGERIYENEKYDTDKGDDQRKAMNPIFLLAGGGGTLINLAGRDGFRVFREKSVASVDASLASPPWPIVHDTSANSASTLSEASRVQTAVCSRDYELRRRDA